MTSLSQEVDKILTDIENEENSLNHIRLLQKLKFNIILEQKRNFRSHYKKALKKTLSYFKEFNESLKDEENLIDFLKKHGYNFELDEHSLEKIEFYAQSLIKLNNKQEAEENVEELRKLVVKEIQHTDYLLHILDYYNGNLDNRLKILNKKVSVSSIPAVLSLKECYEIYRGIRPLFFYHGTRLTTFERILNNKQLSPKKHFNKKFEEEIEHYNKVKSLFVFIKEIENILSEDIDLSHVQKVVNHLRKNKFLKPNKKIIDGIQKEKNKERIKAKLGLLLEELNKLKIKLIGEEADFYSVFRIRDPHFVFFGAEYPYACQENFQSCTNYAGINGAVIEFYPKVYSKLDVDLMRPNSEKILDLAVGTYREHAQVHGFLGHDLATRKKINVKFIRRIYTNNIKEFQKAITKSGLSIEIHPLSHHHKDFLEVMGEIQAILKKNKLIS